MVGSEKKTKDIINVTRKVACAVEMSRRALREVTKDDPAWLHWNAQFFIDGYYGPPRYQDANYILREQLYNTINKEIDIEALVDFSRLGAGFVYFYCFVFIDIRIRPHKIWYPDYIELRFDKDIPGEFSGQIYRFKFNNSDSNCIWSEIPMERIQN